MKYRYFYLEFNPKNQINILGLIEHANRVCRKEHGKFLNEFDLSIGCVSDNAELHYIKAGIWLPRDHKNNNFLL